MKWLTSDFESGLGLGWPSCRGPPRTYRGQAQVMHAPSVAACVEPGDGELLRAHAVHLEPPTASTRKPHMMILAMDANNWQTS